MASQHNHFISKVGIIGAGISGIAAAKQLSHYNPVVFEATDSIGGVWKHCSYNSTKLQTPRCDFEFSDFPWPQRDNSSFPSYTEVLEYLHNYATHFDVLKFVKFNSRVVEIRYVTENDQHTQSTQLFLLNSHKVEQEYGRLLSGRSVWEVAMENSQSKTVEVVLIFLVFNFQHIIIVVQPSFSFRSYENLGQFSKKIEVKGRCRHAFASTMTTIHVQNPPNTLLISQVCMHINILS